MKDPVAAESIRDEILETITEMFGIEIMNSASVELGYMNLKWRIETDAGNFFVKQYHRSRYPEEAVDGLETSLSLQDLLHRNGIPCPELISHQGKYVLRTPSGERFVFMRLCPGKVIEAGSASEAQMYHLGQVTGGMHRIINDGPSVRRALHWHIPTKEWMMANWQERWHEAHAIGCERTIAALDQQKQIIEGIDLEIFSDCEQGWAHWDLFVDNILFDHNRISAILDFDRMHYVFPEFDLSRAVLSCALDHGSIRLSGVSAFVEGYREHRQLTRDTLIRSIRLTWWKEAEWVRAAQEDDSAPLRRFSEENLWVCDNWGQLESLFADL